jgi:hypothetical protein
MHYLRDALKCALGEAFMDDTRYVVETIKNRKTGLLIAMSDQLPGLYVHGRTQEELDVRVPIAIKAMLQAQGQDVNEIVRCNDELPDGFETNVARYALEECVAG